MGTARPVRGQGTQGGSDPGELGATELQSLFPPGAVVAAASEDAWERNPTAEERLYVAGAVAERRREFATGRRCARAALERLGCDGGEIIAMDADRLPIWPAGFVGSISHTKGLCAAVVAGRSQLGGVGLDIEERRRLGESLVARIASPREQTMLLELGDLREWGTVLFSAKEAFYKCYYPETRTYLRFSDVGVTLERDTGRILARLESPGRPSLRGLRELGGRFVLGCSHVACGVAFLPRQARRAPYASARP